MNTENQKSQMRKGMLEYCVLLLLRREPAYASDIIQQLQAADLIVVEGTLYPLLSRLKRDGLRKYYALSPEGQEALASLDEAWNALSKTVGFLRGNNDATINA